MNRTTSVTVSRRGLLSLASSVASSAALAGCTPSEVIEAGNSDPSQVTAYAVNTENVRLIGRTYEEDGARWLPQSGSAIEFEVTGEGLKFELVGDENAGNAPDLCPRYAVLVDGEVVLDETLKERSCTVEVPFDGVFEKADVRLIHLSEASLGAVGVRGITLSADVPSSMLPSADKGMRIAFVGDSITCAYGVEAASTDEPFRTTTQNFMKSYAYLAAQELDADYEAVCYSGYGVVSGWSPDGERNDRMLVPPVYDLVVEGRDYVWDFEEYPCAVVVVNVGTNDYVYTGSDEARKEEFVQGYAAFLDQIRELNPDSFIVCTLGTMWGCGALYPSLERAVQLHAERTGDARVLSYLSDPLDEEADGCGTNGHPNEITHRKMAEALVEVVRSAMAQKG